MSREPSARAAFAWCTAAVLLGGLARAIPCWNDFWLDEVWTWFSVRRLASPLEVFTRLHDSNNNHLNSLLVYALGDRADWAVYRLPSWLAGTASIALAAHVARRRGRLESVLAAWLTAGSFALLHFSSEARGYALAVAFALAALAALERHLERGDRASAAAFAACACLGALAHLSFLFFHAGAFAWSARRLLRPGPALGSGLARLAALHGPPAVALAALWWVDLRHMVVHGGIPAELAPLVARSVGFALGLPVAPGLALPYALLAGALLALGLRERARSGDGSAWLFAIAIAIAPLLVLGALRPEVIDVRYFLIGIALFLLLASDGLAALIRAGGARRAAGLALLALFLAGNAAHTAAFLTLGRGGFRAALRLMAERSEGAAISVSSDHDFRNGMVLRFYARELPAGRRLAYAPRDAIPPGGTEWRVLHRAQRPEHPPRVVADGAGNRYGLVAEFDHAAISGFWWAVYRNLARDAPAPGSG
jgi:hypothetical protein